MAEPLRHDGGRGRQPDSFWARRGRGEVGGGGAVAEAEPVHEPYAGVAGGGTPYTQTHNPYTMHPHRVITLLIRLLTALSPL